MVEKLYTLNEVVEMYVSTVSNDVKFIEKNGGFDLLKKSLGKKGFLISKKPASLDYDNPLNNGSEDG